MKNNGCLTNKEITQFVTYTRDSDKMSYDQFIELAKTVNSHIFRCHHCLEKVRIAREIADKKGIVDSETYLLSCVYGVDSLVKTIKKKNN